MKRMTMKQIREALAYLSIVDMMHVEGLATATINENAARIEYKAQGGRPIRCIHISSRARKANLEAIAAAVAEAIGADRWTEIVNVVTGEEAETIKETETTTETIEEEEHIMKKYFKVTFEYAEGIYCTNLAHAESIEDVERHYSEYAWQSVKEAQPWDVDEARAKGMPVIEIEYAEPTQEAAEALETAEKAETEEQTAEAQETTTEAAEAVTLAPADAACVWTEDGETITTNEQKKEDNTMNNTSTATKTAPVFVRTLEGEYIAIRDLTDEAKELGYMATQYERYGSVTADEIIDAYIAERVNITIEDLGAYNEYLRENNYYDDEIMSWDDLEDYLRDMPPLDAFKLAHNSDFSWNDDYFTFNGYGNLRGMQEYEVVRKMEEDRDFLKWYVEEREPIEDETMEQAIAYCNYLIKQGY